MVEYRYVNNIMTQLAAIAMNTDLGQTIHDLKSLPIAQRLQVVEAVWNSIAEDPTPITLSEDQKAELTRRLEAYKANPEDVLTLDQILEQLHE